MLSDLKSIFKHTSVYGFSTVLQKGIGFFMIPVYTGFLSPKDYGILELMELTINIVSMLIGMRLGVGIIRYYHDYQNETDRKELFSTALLSVIAIAISISILLYFWADHFAYWILGSKAFGSYFQIIFTAMGLQIIATVPENILLAEEKSMSYSFVTVLTLISYLAFNILFLVIYRIGLIGILYSMLITKIFNTGMLLTIIRSRIAFCFSFTKFMELFKFSIPLVPASVLMFAMHYSDRFFIQKYCDLNELGLYSLGYKFGMIISVIISEPFFRIWNTKRFALAKKENAKQEMGVYFTYYVLVVISAALAISVLIREVIIIMTPSEYAGATAIVFLVAVGYILYGISNFFNLGMMVTYKTKSLAYIQVGVAIFNIILNYFSIRYWGIHGAVFSTVVSFFLLAAISLAVSQYLYTIKIEYKRILILCALFLGLVYLAGFIHYTVFHSLILKIALLCLFPAILYFLGFFSKIEKEKGLEMISAGLAKARHRFSNSG